MFLVLNTEFFEMLIIVEYTTLWLCAKWVELITIQVAKLQISEQQTNKKNQPIYYNVGSDKLKNHGHRHFSLKRQAGY